MDKKDYKLNMLFPMLLIGFMFALSLIFIVYTLQKNAIYKEKSRTVANFKEILNAQIQEQAAMLEGYINFIMENRPLVEALTKKDREALDMLSKDIYTDLNTKVDVTHFYFIGTDGTILFRAHDTKRYGDYADRYTFRGAQQSKKTYYGIEFGVKRNHTLRVVKPVIIDNTVVGYLELGKEMDKIINNLSLLLKTEIYVAVKKEFYENSKDFSKEKLDAFYAIDDMIVTYNTGTIPKNLNTYFLDEDTRSESLKYGDKTYHLYASPFLDVSKRDLGYFIFLTDSTLEYQITYNIIKILALFILFAFVIFAVLSRIYIKRKEEEIHNLDNEIEQHRDELQAINEHLLERIEEGVTERIALEKEKKIQEDILSQQSKMASAGEMMNAIIHQWKQPINVVSLLVQNLEEELEFGEIKQESIKSGLKDISKQMEFMALTMSDFKNFFRPSKEKRIFKACETFEEVLKMFNKQYLQAGMKVTIQPHTHFYTVGYPNEFKHVILNILNNSRDAFVEKGIKKGVVDINFIVKDGIGTCTIEDNAGGIPIEILDKVFEPYVSTKGENGTGIGLHIARTIIRDSMGGSIEAINTETGVRFIIRLPIVEENNV